MATLDRSRGRLEAWLVSIRTTLSVGNTYSPESSFQATQPRFSSMRNNMFDELLCDYDGTVSALGRFRADWLLRFVGLERFPDYRDGGRLQNYRGDPPLSDAAFVVLQRLIERAAVNLEAFDSGLADDSRGTRGRAIVLLALTSLTLEQLAHESAVSEIESSLTSAVTLTAGS